MVTADPYSHYRADTEALHLGRRVIENLMIRLYAAGPSALFVLKRLLT